MNDTLNHNKIILFFQQVYMEMFQVNKTDAEQMIYETPLHRRDTLKDMRSSDSEDSSDSE